MSAELAPCFVCGRPSSRPGGHPRCALNAAKPQPDFAPVGQRVRVTGGEHHGRTGVVVYLGLGEYRSVLFDRKQRERTDKVELVREEHLEAVTPAMLASAGAGWRR